MVKDFSMSSQAEQSIPQLNISSPRIVEPGTYAQQVESTQQSTGDGAEAILKPASLAKRTWLFFVDHLRAFLIILVIMHHVAITYGASGLFYYHDTTNTLSALCFSRYSFIESCRLPRQL
jgi:hypothetical protein